MKRLFVEEDDDGDEDEGGGGPLRGQRIFILSFQGDLLYTYAHPDGHYFGSICNFDGKLLAPVRIRPLPSDTADDAEVVEMCIAVTALAGA